MSFHRRPEGLLHPARATLLNCRQGLKAGCPILSAAFCEKGGRVRLMVWLEASRYYCTVIVFGVLKTLPLLSQAWKTSWCVPGVMLIVVSIMLALVEARLTLST